MNAPTMLSVLAALLLAVPGTACAAWPIYGHDLSNTRDAGNDGPAASKVPSLAQAWDFDPQTGDFTGTPVVAGGVLVAGNNGGWVYALDAVTGKVLWAKNVGQPINGSAAIDLRAPGQPTVYVPVAQVDRPRLLALSLSTGKTLWDRTLVAWPGASVYGSPVFWRGAVYIGVSSFEDDSTVRGELIAFDQRSGKVRWQTYTVPPGRDGATIWTTPAIDTGTGIMYTGLGNNYHTPTDTEESIMAFKASTGKILRWYQATSGDSFALPGNPTGPDADFGASANLFTSKTGERLVGEGQKTGIYWALDRTTMKPVWHTQVGPGGQFGGIIGSTAWDGAHVYGAEVNTGQVFALGSDGNVSWETAEGGVAHVGPATIAHRVLYTVDPTGFLVARDPASSQVLTRQPLGQPSFGGVSAAGGAIYVEVGTGELPRLGGLLPYGAGHAGEGQLIAFGDTSRSGGCMTAARGRQRTSPGSVCGRQPPKRGPKRPKRRSKRHRPTHRKHAR